MVIYLCGFQQLCYPYQLSRSGGKSSPGGEGQHGRYMAKVKSVTDHENVSFGIRSRLAKRIIPHSIPDPERLFSSVRKIVIDHRTRLDSSTDVI